PQGRGIYKGEPVFDEIKQQEWAATTTPKIGIIGTGNMGRIHARVLSNIRALAAVADTDMRQAEEVAKMYNVDAFNDFDSLIEHSELDGIIISTPTSTHAEIAESVAKKQDGIKGILIEKPLASSLKDARKLAEVLRKKDIIVLVGHSEIYNPVVERALNLIKEGAIGVPQTVIHDRRGFVQASRLSSLGDVFEDIGVHDFDIMTRISSGNATLYAQCQSKNGILNTGNVTVRFENEAQHIFHLSRQYVGRKRSMDVSGTKGTLNLDLFGQVIKVQDLDKAPLADSRTIQLLERGATIKVYGEPVLQVINDFLHCIETGSSPKVGLDDGILALEVVEAARKSAVSGRVVNINIQSRHV
ncbi:MAG: Gfo/Idh/MocA family protein, partial [Candidatus Thorarchaeota archaeon]